MTKPALHTLPQVLEHRGIDFAQLLPPLGTVCDGAILSSTARQKPRLAGHAISTATLGSATKNGFTAGGR
jgi:hypothetical protein